MRLIVKQKILTLHGMANGFTLIEVMVALLVVGIGLVIVLQVFPSGFSIEKNSQLETQAVMTAQEKIEFLTSLSFPEIVTGTFIENSLPSPFQKFSRTTKIFYIDSNIQESASPTVLKKAEVLVEWASPLKIGNKQVKLVTLFTEK